MVDRYSREEMKAKWSIQAKYQAWLDVEKAVVVAWNKLGLIPDEDAEKIGTVQQAIDYIVGKK